VVSFQQTRPIVKIRAAHFQRPVLAALAAAGLGLGVPAFATGMTYQAVFVTNVKLGTKLYQNAAVTVSFQGDTADITAAVDQNGTPIASTMCTNTDGTGNGYFFLLSKGTASLSIESQGRTVSAQFAPGQVFVALDTCNGGIGFGSFTGPNGLEAAYPVAFTLGTALSFSESTANPLGTAANLSGNAWSCIGYPPETFGTDGKGDGLCFTPESYPLHTTAGDALFYLPYENLVLAPGLPYDGTNYGNHSGSLNRGTFSITPTRGGN
jgi:hypothetical protein